MVEDFEKLSGALFRPEEKPGTYEEVFEKLGFREHAKASTLWKKLIPVTGLEPEAGRHASYLLTWMMESPDPDMALLNLSRFADAVISPAQLLNSILLEKPICHLLTVIFSSSYYLSDILVRNPEYLSWLIEKSTLEPHKPYSIYLKELQGQTAPFRDRRRRLNSIKRYRRREVLRIGARDLLGLAPVEEVTAELSFLADAVIETVTRLSFEEEAVESRIVARDDSAAVRSGKPGERPFHRFAVLSLGKLGGTELNYSSDIDLLYICGAGADKREVEFYTSLARRITEYLSSPTEEGTLFRVDLRLRPDGETGPLVVTTDEHLNYLLSRARPWEKQALLKARFTAGDTSVADDFKANCDHVIFSPIDEPNPLPGILAMRERAIAHLSAREREGNIKLMSGGIRDIEFIAQALQLLHGRSRPEVRSRNTLEALERLHHYGLLSDDVLESIGRCYRLYRTIEHRLQMLRDARTHTLPVDETELLKLGARVSHSTLEGLTGDNFRTQVSRSIRQVQILFKSFFKDQSPGEIPLILSLPPGEKEVAGILGNYGIREGESAHRFLSSLVYGDFPKLEGPGTLQAAASSLPPILEEVSETPDPSLTLKNLVRIVKSSGAVRSTLELLAGGGGLLRLLLVIASLSTKLTETISNRIELLDLLAEGVHPGEIPAAGKDRKNFPLVRWYEESLLFIHCQNPIPENGPDVLGPLFSEAMEKVIKALFTVTGGMETPAALFALGSLGNRQCRFGSDLDLLAVIPDDCDPAETTGVLRDMIRLGGQVDIGPLDLRLRGEGGGSPLAQTLEHYRTYFETRAGLWEHLAFTRCRYICGDEETGNAFIDILAETSNIIRRKPGLSAGLAAAREKLESLSGGRWDVKHAPGGLYDINFILASASLHGSSNAGFQTHSAGPCATVFDGTLERLTAEGLLEEGDSITLKNAYRLYYLTEHAAALHGFRYPPLPEREAFLVGYMDRLLGHLVPGAGSFTGKLETVKGTIRDIFLRYLDRLGGR